MRSKCKRVTVLNINSVPSQSAGISHYACRAGWLLHVISHEDVHAIKNSRPDGIICLLFVEQTEMIPAIRAAGVPVVAMSSVVADIGPRVIIDVEAEGRRAAEHLIERGFTRLVYIGRKHYEHYQGMTAAARSAGASLTAIDPTDPDVRRQIGLRDLGTANIHDNDSPQRRVWARRFFSGCQKPVGVLTSNTFWAVDIIEGCQDARILVPEQVAVICKAAHPEEGQAFPIPLTTIAPNYELHGFLAAGLLDRMFHGEPIAADTVLRAPPFAIKARESTMCHATENLPVARAATFIMRNLHDENLSAKQVCHEKGVARCVLYKDFRTHFKMTIARYIEQLRVEDAKEILATTRATAEEIAGACGFGEVLRFRRAFKRVTGMAPNQYRRSHTRAVAATAHGHLPIRPTTRTALPDFAVERSDAFSGWSSARAAHPIHFSAQPSGGPVSGPVSEPVSEPVSQSCTLESKVLKLLSAGPAGTTSLARSLGHKSICGRLKRVVRALLKDHVVQWTIPGKPKSRLQQYRLTEKGHALISN